MYSSRHASPSLENKMNNSYDFKIVRLFLSLSIDLTEALTGMLTCSRIQQAPTFTCRPIKKHERPVEIKNMGRLEEHETPISPCIALWPRIGQFNSSVLMAGTQVPTGLCRRRPHLSCSPPKLAARAVADQTPAVIGIHLTLFRSKDLSMYEFKIPSCSASLIYRC